MSAEEVQALAGEYALGLLDPVAAADVERRATREPALATAIADWRFRLIEIDDAAPRIAPSANLWSRIDGALDAAAEPAVRPVPGPNGRSWLSWLWSEPSALRGAALAGAAASVVLAALAVTSYEAAQRQPQVIAVLLSPDSRPGAVVEVFGDGSSYVAPLTDVTVPKDRIMQVWTLPSKETGPVSIGLLERDGSARLQPVSLPDPKPQQLYEITLEPSGGSPTGKPTGPILFKGFAERPR